MAVLEIVLDLVLETVLDTVQKVVISHVNQLAPGVAVPVATTLAKVAVHNAIKISI